MLANNICVTVSSIITAQVPLKKVLVFVFDKLFLFDTLKIVAYVYSYLYLAIGLYLEKCI